MTAELHSRPGRIRAALAGGIALLAVLAILLAGAPTEFKLALAVLVLAGAVVSQRNPPRHRIRLPADGPAALDGVAGTLGARAATPLFVDLELVAPDGTRRRAGLFRDELPADEFRALLAFLRNG